MPGDAELSLGLWKEVGRHVRADETLDRVAGMLRGRLPIGGLVLRHIDNARSAVETLAQAPASFPAARTECTAAALQRLSAWCAQGDVVHGPAAQVDTRLAGLLPAGVGPDADLLVGGLAPAPEILGAVVVVASPAARFDPAHERLIASALEPLGALVRNDRQLRELESLREAAEADRRSLLSRLGRQDIADTVVGSQSGLREVMERVELVARSDAPVLIQGETGTGKEVVARAVHTRSRRTAGPFLRVNCGAIPPELIDSELFGHERGSFTGAVAQRKGWFERADAGTLFLDEVGELPAAAQVRLLRVLQDGSLQRVGGQQQLAVDVRVVAATNRDLAAMVQAGSFRADLWYRIAVFPIHLPALRDRIEDIAALAAHFAVQAAKRLGLAPRSPSAADIGLLTRYAWPGNVRELASVMERAAILGDGRGLEVARALGAAPEPVAPVAPPMAAQPSDTLDGAMARHIEAALAKTYGRIEGPFGAARLLGINPHTLRARMRKLGVDWRHYREGVR